jgi:cytochrome o ubiquinol oxidase subunit 3
MSERATERVEVHERKMLGFWIYLMTDCVLFAGLFATFAVLRGATAGGPSGAEIFDLQYVLLETMLLLMSSFTMGLALIGFARGYKKQALGWLIATFVLGAAFLGLELFEFTTLAAEGHSWQTSAFLSSYFTLVGTHGLHIAVGLLWLIVLIVRLKKFNFRKTDLNRLALFGLFWHFLDIVWIFVFSIVYLIGGMA